MGNGDGNDYQQRYDQGADTTAIAHDAGGAPGKRARTDGLPTPPTKAVLGQAAQLYDDAQVAVAQLTIEADDDKATALSGVVKIMFISAEGLFGQLDRLPKTPAQDGQIQELKAAFAGLQEKAIPRMDDHAMAPTTGVGVVDKGFGCEADDKQDGCYLTDDKRAKVWAAFNVVVGSAMDNYRDAILNVQLDELTRKDPSAWGFLAEFLFYSATGPLIGMAVKGLKGVRAAAKAARDSNKFWQDQGTDVMYSTAFEKAIGKVRDEDVSAVLQNASRGLRAHLKHQGHAPSADVSFLRLIQDKIKMLSDDIMLEAPAQLSDVELVALMRAYKDAGAHSVSSYETQVRSLLTRFQSQGLAQLNDEFADGGKRTAITLVAYGQRKTAILDTHGTQTTRSTYDHTLGGGAAHGDPNAGDGLDKLQTIVDPDLAPLAQEISAGGEVEYDLSYLADEAAAPWVLQSRNEAAGPDPFKMPSWWRAELKAWAIEAKAQAGTQKGAV